MHVPPHKGMPPLPMDEDGPVFREPWEAAAFALVLKLYQGGHFTWTEWVECLSAEIKTAQREGDPDLGRTYYRHWLAALERLVIGKGLAPGAELAVRRIEIETSASRHVHAAKREPVRIA